MITNMVSKESLQKIKQDVEGYVGQRVCIKTNVGRNKCEYKEGVIANTYPSVFSIVDDSTSNSLSFSYTDLLTNSLELSLPNGEAIADADYSVSCIARF